MRPVRRDRHVLPDTVGRCADVAYGFQAAQCPEHDPRHLTDNQMLRRSQNLTPNLTPKRAALRGRRQTSVDRVPHLTCDDGRQ